MTMRHLHQVKITRFSVKKQLYESMQHRPLLLHCSIVSNIAILLQCNNNDPCCMGSDTVWDLFPPWIYFEPRAENCCKEISCKQTAMKLQQYCNNVAAILLQCNNNNPCCMGSDTDPPWIYFEPRAENCCKETSLSKPKRNLAHNKNSKK